MAASDSAGDDSLYPIAVLIDELKNEDVQVSRFFYNDFGKSLCLVKYIYIHYENISLVVTY